MKRILLFSVLLSSPALFAQDIINTLGAGGLFYVKDAVNTYMTLKQSTAHVGIGLNVTNPRATLEVGGHDGLLVTGAANTNGKDGSIVIGDDMYFQTA